MLSYALLTLYDTCDLKGGNLPTTHYSADTWVTMGKYDNQYLHAPAMYPVSLSYICKWYESSLTHDPPQCQYVGLDGQVWKIWVQLSRATHYYKQCYP